MIQKFQQKGATVVILGTSKEIIGLIAIADPLKPFAKQVVSRIHNQGLNTYMLTGDNQYTAQAIANQAGINNVFCRSITFPKIG